jgi:uncharacterized protein (TIRG00374 family)
LQSTTGAENLMEPTKYRITWKTILLPVIGILAFLIYLYLFNVDIPTIMSTAGIIDLRLYLLAILSVLLDTLFYAFSWRLLLNFLSVKISIAKSYLFVWYGIFIDTIIPAESLSGEISRVYLVEREQNGTSGKVVASLATHRLIGMGINVTSLIVGIAILLGQRQVSELIFSLTIFLASATTFFLFFLILICFREKWTLSIINTVLRLLQWLGHGRWKISKIREGVIKATRMFHDSMKEFRHAPKTLFGSLCFSIASWFSSLSVAYLVFLALNYQVQWSIILVTCSIVTAVKSIPVGVPFEVGLPEITMTTLYILLGVPPDIAATSTILSRILTLWLRFFIGFSAQQWLELRRVRYLKNSDN